MRKLGMAHRINKLIPTLRNVRMLATMVALMVTGVFSTAAVLTADRNTASKSGELQNYLCAVDIFYKGAMVCVNNAGYLAPAADAVGYSRVVGVADENVDNSGGSVGDLSCRVRAGRSFQFATASIAVTDVGRIMYVTDDQTFEDVQGTNSIAAGILLERDSNTVGWIFIPKPSGGIGGAGQIRSDRFTGQDESSDNTYTLAAMRAQDHLVAVWHVSTAAAIATWTDVTSVFSAADGSLDGDGSTDRTNDLVIAIWVKDG